MVVPSLNWLLSGSTRADARFSILVKNNSPALIGINVVPGILSILSRGELRLARNLMERDHSNGFEPQPKVEFDSMMVRGRHGARIVGRPGDDLARASR
jgi:hypothetical protein